MKDSTVYIYLIPLIISICLIISCGSDCEDVKIGDIDPPNYIFDYSVYESEQMLTFANEAGERYQFTTDTFNMSGRLNLREIGTGSDNQNGSFTCYEYMSTYGLLLQLEDPTERNTLQLQFYTLGNTEESLEYILIMNAGWNEPINADNEVLSGFSQGEYNMTTNEIITPSDTSFKVSIIDNWVGNDLLYENVIEISSENNSLYFKAGVGIVGFTRLNDELFTLII